MTGCPAMQADENFDCPAKKMKAHHGRYDENMQRPQRDEDMKRPQRPCPKNPEVLPPLPKSDEEVFVNLNQARSTPSSSNYNYK